MRISLFCTAIALTLLAGASAQSASAADQVTSGTGFAISPAGIIATNAHVVASCSAITVRTTYENLPAVLVGSDTSNDLAILRIARSTNHAVFRQSPQVRPGDQALTFGFPLSGALAPEGNLTVGHVSALSGLGGNPNYLQISTPVQPGNSGGPLLDAAGNVIGVVTSRLNTLRMLEATGEIPQNVNFAINAATLKRFLANLGLTAAEAPSTREMNPADVGEAAKRFTFPIFCTSSSPPQAGNNKIEHVPAPDLRAAPSTVPVKVSLIKFADIRQLYPTWAPEDFQIVVANGAPETLVDLVIGFYASGQKRSCSTSLADYNGFRRFKLFLPTGDSVALKEKFGPHILGFCVVTAQGVAPAAASSVDFSSYSQLRFSDIKQLYPSVAPEDYQIIVANGGSKTVHDLIIGFKRSAIRHCLDTLSDYDGYKRFSLNLLPGDSVTLRAKFGANAQNFCIVRPPIFDGKAGAEPPPLPPIFYGKFPEGVSGSNPQPDLQTEKTGAKKLARPKVRSEGMCMPRGGGSLPVPCDDPLAGPQRLR